MKWSAFILNIPWTLIGLIVVVISIPKRLSFNKEHLAFVFEVKSFWWYTWLPNKKGTRAMAVGHVVLLGENILRNDLEHELAHVEQSIRQPFIHPFLTLYHSWRYGYINSKYEVEAYGKTGSIYVSHEFNFGDDKELVVKLKNLVLEGKKIATTGLYKEGQVIPKVGEYGAIVDGNKKRFCIVQYTSTEVKPFLEVGFDYIKKEGEGDRNVEEWREKHRKFFSHNSSFNDKSLVVCEEFKLTDIL